MRQRRGIQRTDARRAAGRPGIVVVVVLGAGVALAGCTSSGGDTPEESDGPRPEAAEPTREPLPIGPLDALLAAVTVMDTETPEAQEARMQRREELIGACMAEQGFDYRPTDWAPFLEAERRSEGDPGPGVAAGVDFDPIEAAREYGYGIFTDGVDPEPPDVSDFSADPNDELVAQMSAAEQRAWDHARYGPGQGEDYASGRIPYDWTRYGCVGAADHELGVDTQGFFDDSPWSDLRDQIGALQASVPDDPAMADARAAWVACMDATGHGGYATVDAPMTEMMRRSEQIWNEVNAGVNVDLSTDDYLTDPAYLQQQADMAAARAKMVPIEIELAATDVTCRAEAGYEERLARVWLDRQEEFYAEHQGDLDAWLAAFMEFDATR